MRLLRRRFFTLLTAALLFGAACAEEDVAPGKETTLAAHELQVQMHKNPGCGCCDLWAEHLREHGFTVASTPDPDILELKGELGIPRPAMSCHTAMIGDYFVEGHVPATDILRLLREKPEHVTGLAVPGMPLGSPGMEHAHPQDFNTIALLSDGTAYVFETHAAGEDFSATE